MLLGVFIAIMVVSAIALLALFRKVIDRNISSATDHFNELSQDYIKKQEEIQVKLDEMNQMHKKTVAEAQEEADKIKADALKQAGEEKDKIVKEAHSHSEELIKQAEKARQALILDMERKIKDGAIKEASQLIGEVLSEGLRKNVHSYLVDEFINTGLDGLAKFEAVGDIKEAAITSAFALSKKEIDAIGEGFKKKTAKELQFSQSVDKALISGLVVTVGSLVIDVSLKWKIKEKTREFIKENEG